MGFSNNSSGQSLELLHQLAVAHLRARVSRTRLGLWWLGISNFIYIIVVGAIWAQLWRMPIDFFLPYIGVGHIVYVYTAGTLSESSAALVGDARIHLASRTPAALSVAAHVYRSSLLFLMNAPLLITLVLWSSDASTKSVGACLLGYVLTTAFLFFGSYSLALLTLRFRDLGQLTTLVFMLAFLVSPVMWQVNMLPDKYHLYVYINPIASALEVIRNPVIGMAVDPSAYAWLLGWIFFAALVAMLVHLKYRRGFIFWF